MPDPQNRGMPWCQLVQPTFHGLMASRWGPTKGGCARVPGCHLNPRRRAQAPTVGPAPGGVRVKKRWSWQQGIPLLGGCWIHFWHWFDPVPRFPRGSRSASPHPLLSPRPNGKKPLAPAPAHASAPYSTSGLPDWWPPQNLL